jgi:NAD(P)H-dependent FMN reductase
MAEFHSHAALLAFIAGVAAIVTGGLAAAIRGVLALGIVGLDRDGDRLLAALRAADGVIISTPGYHGGMSGLLKNALDYIEEMAGDERPYLDRLPVGCIAVARGSQGAVSALDNLRTVIHALRGFPTPYGAAVTLPAAVPGAGWLTGPVRERLELVGQQVYGLAAALRCAADLAYDACGTQPR